MAVGCMTVALLLQCCKSAHGCCHGSRIAGSVLPVGHGAAMAVGCMAVQSHCGLGAAMAVGCMAVQLHCGIGAAMAVGCMAVALRHRCCCGSRLHGSRIAASVLPWQSAAWQCSCIAASVLPWQAAAWQSHHGLGAAMAGGCMAA